CGRSSRAGSRTGTGPRRTARPRRTGSRTPTPWPAASTWRCSHPYRVPGTRYRFRLLAFLGLEQLLFQVEVAPQRVPDLPLHLEQLLLHVRLVLEQPGDRLGDLVQARLQALQLRLPDLHVPVVL